MNESVSNKETIPLEVHIAQEKDVEGVVDVLYRTWLATYPNEDAGITVDDIEDRFIVRRSEEGLEKSRKRIREQSSNERTFVVKDGEKVIGVSVVSKDEMVNRLIAIYVLPEYQGRGVGYMLWNSVLQFFDTEKDIVVEVVTYNANAIAFYTHLGFQDTGRRFSNEIFRMKSGSVLPEMEMRIAKTSNQHK
jgi:ribosomal protein S18 acetylase RimI-like enzyme